MQIFARGLLGCLATNYLNLACFLTILKGSYPSTRFRTMKSTPAESGNPVGAQFRRLWPCITADSNFTLHGFRRFKTTHLLNLRFLENEIAELDHIIYQAGLSLEGPLSPLDRLGLKYSKKDANVPAIHETITKEFVLKLRGLIQQYGMCP